MEGAGADTILQHLADIVANHGRDASKALDAPGARAGAFRRGGSAADDWASPAHRAPPRRLETLSLLASVLNESRDYEFPHRLSPETIVSSVKSASPTFALSTTSTATGTRVIRRRLSFAPAARPRAPRAARAAPGPRIDTFVRNRGPRTANVRRAALARPPRRERA